MEAGESVCSWGWMLAKKHEFLAQEYGTEKAHKLFQHTILSPTRNAPLWAPRRSVCASFPGKERKKGTHINFFGENFGVKKEALNGPFWATRSKVYCFIFSALKECHQSEVQTPDDTFLPLQRRM